MLRVVEVHRTAEGGWELVEGPPKPLHTFDTGGPSGAAAAAATPTFLPLAALFAECLQQDSQMNAAFELALSQRDDAQAPVEADPPAPTPSAPAAGEAQAQASPPCLAEPAPAMALARAQLKAQPQGLRPDEMQGQLVAERVGSETQPDVPACGLLRQLSQVPATPSDPQEQLVEAGSGEPAGMVALGIPANGEAALAAAAAAAGATPPLETPAAHVWQHPTELGECAQPAALPFPQQLQFVVPETAVDLRPGPQQFGTGSLPCVSETAADVLLPQFVPETAAELTLAADTAPCEPHLRERQPQQQQQQQRQPLQFVPETAVDLPPLVLPFVPETAAEVVPAAAAALQPEQHQQHFVPETGAELLAEPAASHQHAQQPTGVPGAAELGPLRHLFVTATASPADVLPATAADELAAVAPHGCPAAVPGSLLPPEQPPAVKAGAPVPPPACTAAPQPQLAGLQPLAKSAPEQLQPHRQQEQQWPAAGGGLQDFDVQVEAPTSMAAPAAGGAPPGGDFDYDVGPTQPSPETSSRPQRSWPGVGRWQQPQPHQHRIWPAQPPGHQQQQGRPPGQPPGGFRPHHAPLPAQPGFAASRPTGLQEPQRQPTPLPQQHLWQPGYQQAALSLPQNQPGRGSARPLAPQPPYQQRLGGPRPPQRPVMPPPSFQPRALQQPHHAAAQPVQQQQAWSGPRPPAGALQPSAGPGRLPVPAGAAPSSTVPSAAAPMVQGAEQTEQPRKRVSLLDRPQGTFKPVRPLTSQGGAAAPTGAAATGPPPRRPANAAVAAGESGDAKRRRIQAFQAELASILEVDPDQPAAPGGPACGTGFGSAAAARVPEDKEARKARIAAELEAELFGHRGGGGAGDGGRGGGGGPAWRGGGTPTAQPSWRPPIPHQASVARQSQQRLQHQGGLPAQQQHHHQHQHHRLQQQQPARQLTPAPPNQQPPRLQQQQQQALPPAHQEPPQQDNDVMADVAPGAFVTAGRKQAWRISAGDQGRLAALLRDLQADTEVVAQLLAGAATAPPGQNAAVASANAESPQQQAQLARSAADPGQPEGEAPAAAGWPGEPAAAPAFLPATAAAEPELPPVLPATAVADLSGLGQCELPVNVQQGSDDAVHAQLAVPAPQAFILPATALAEPGLEALESASLGLSAEPMSLETARQLADAEAAALGDRQQQHPQQQQQQQQPVAVLPTCSADGAETESSPVSGGKRRRGDEGAAQPAPVAPPAKQQRQEGFNGAGAADAGPALVAGEPVAAAAEPAEAAPGQAQQVTEPQPQEGQQQAQQPTAAVQPQQVEIPVFTTGNGGSVTVSAARLRAAEALLGGPAASGMEQSGVGGAAEEGEEEEAPCQNTELAEKQVEMPMFCTGNGGSVTTSAAKLQAAEALFGDAGSGGGQGKAKHPARPEASRQVDMPMFSTGNGGSVTTSAAKLQAAKALFGDAGGGGGQGKAEHPARPEASRQVDMPMFSTGNGGSVTTSAANLQAAKALFGDAGSGGGGSENEDVNEQPQTGQADGGESTPLLRKQLLRSRVAEESTGAESPGAAAPVDGISTPAGAASGTDGTTPSSAPLPGRGKTAGLSRFAPAATTGQLKRKGRRPFVTPGAAGGSGRKFKPPSMATPGGAGASRLGANGSAASAHKPAVQLHDLQGTLLKRILSEHSSAAPQAAAEGAQATAASAAEIASDRAAAETPAAVAGPTSKQGGAGAAGAAAELPLDSSTCSEFLVPDLLHPSRGPTAAGSTAFPAAEADGEAGVQGRQQQEQAGEAAAGAAPMAVLSWRELRQRLLDAGANPAYASVGWVKNHYRWVVWKLARLQLLLAGSTDAGMPGCSRAAPALLTAALVMDELQYRYEREFNRGHRPLLRAVLQHDEVASAAMVLMVASVHLPPGAARGSREDSGTAAAATLELTDGWYWIRASCDQRLTRLARSGRISQGDKLRICGGELTSPGPGDPLEAASTAVLRITANSAHPAPPGARLGRQRRRGVFVPLGLLEESGGPLPQTLVVVHRVFPRLVYCGFSGGSSNIMTPRQYEAMLADQEGLQQRLASEAAAEVQRQELQQCRQWLQHGKRGGMSQFDRIYAQHVVQQAGDGSGDSGILSQLSEADRRGMQRYIEQRQAQLQAQQQGWLQERRQAVGSMPERTQELLQIEVGEVCHASVLDARPGGRQAWRPAVATITMWGCAEELAAELREGAIFKVTHLAPQKHKPRPGLALKGTSSTRWTLYAASAAVLPPGLLCQPWLRRRLGLAALPGCPLGTVFDYTGQLLGLSRPLQGQGPNTTFQWLFFADHTLPQPTQPPQQSEQGQEAQRQEQMQQAKTPAPPCAAAGLAEAKGSVEDEAALAAAIARAAIAAALLAEAHEGEGVAAASFSEAAAAALRSGAAAQAAADAAPLALAAAPAVASAPRGADIAAPARAAALAAAPAGAAAVPPAAPAAPTAAAQMAAPAAVAGAAVPVGAGPASAPAAAGPPWLLAVRLFGKTPQLDWLDPSDVGSIFTLRDLALEGADQEARLWRAGATECSAVHRHKAATLAAAARSRAAAAAAPRGSGGGTSTAGVADPAASAAAEVAAWAAANAAVVLELQGRIQAVLR